jgi:hypothetical protein
MKNLFKILGATVVMLALSATSAMAQANPGGVEVVKDGQFWFLTDQGECTGIPIFWSAYSSTMQFKNGLPHMYIGFFDVSDYCGLPENGTLQIEKGTTSLKIMPTGIAILKIVVNPNQP